MWSYFSKNDEKSVAINKGVDIQKDRYTGSIEQRNFINKKIQEYQKIDLELTNSGKTLSTICSSVLLLYFSGPVPAILLLAGYYALGNYSNPTDIKTKLHEQQTKLKELLHIYQWMAQEGPKVSYDVSLIQVLQAIANRIVRTEDLIPISFIGHTKEINVHFFSAFENTPHAIVPQMIDLIYNQKNAVVKDISHLDNSKKFLNYAPKLFRGAAYQRMQQGFSQMMFGYDSKLEEKSDASRPELNFI